MVPAERPAMVSTSAGERRAWLSFIWVVLDLSCWIFIREGEIFDDELEAPNVLQFAEAEKATISPNFTDAVHNSILKFL
jgi:hypothetical protein